MGRDPTRRELDEAPGGNEGLSQRGGRKRWERCFDETWLRKGLERKGERDGAQVMHPHALICEATGTLHCKVLSGCKVLILGGRGGPVRSEQKEVASCRQSNQRVKPHGLRGGETALPGVFKPSLCSMLSMQMGRDLSLAPAFNTIIASRSPATHGLASFKLVYLQHHLLVWDPVASGHV